MSRPSHACAALSVALVWMGFLTSCGGSSTAVDGDPASFELWWPT
jgi:hypothetical protein